MITTTGKRAKTGTVMALGFLLGMLMAMVLSPGTTAGAGMPTGRAFAWGENFSGQLGNGNPATNNSVPVAVKNLTGVKSVKASGYHTLALKTDGTVYAWDSDYAGQLGDGLDAGNNENEPDKIERLSGIESVSAGFRTSFASK